MYLNTKDMMVKRQEDKIKCVKKALISSERAPQPLRRDIHEPNEHAMRDHLLPFESAHITAAALQKGHSSSKSRTVGGLHLITAITVYSRWQLGMLTWVLFIVYLFYWIKDRRKSFKPWSESSVPTCLWPWIITTLQGWNTNTGCIHQQLTLRYVNTNFSKDQQ